MDQKNILNQLVTKLLLILLDLNKQVVVDRQGQGSVPPIRPLEFNGRLTSIDLGRVQSYAPNNVIG